MQNKMKKGPSIFDLERRKDFVTSFTSLFEELCTTDVCPEPTRLPMKMNLYMDYCIRYWPYRCGASSVPDYLDNCGIDITSPKSDVDFLWMLELYVNLLHWSQKQNSIDAENQQIDPFRRKSHVEKEAERFLENIDYILEPTCSNRPGTDFREAKTGSSSNSKETSYSFELLSRNVTFSL